MSVFGNVGDSDSEHQDLNTPTQPNQHTARGRQTETTSKTWADYQKLRKENPSQYYRPSVQAKMHSDAAKLGTEAFFGSANKDKNWWEDE